MKTICSLLIVMSMAMATFANNEIKVDSKIEGVTVFLSGAQISRTAKISIKAGTHDLVFTGLSRHVNPQSIQVAAQGKLTVLSVMHRTNYMESQEIKAEIKDLQEKVEKLENDIILERNLLEVLRQEKQMLLANQAIGGENNGVQYDQLTQSVEYFRQRMTDIEKKLFAGQLKLKEMEKEQIKLKLQVKELNVKKSSPTSEVVVSVSSKTGGSVSFVLEYAIYQAGWKPLYDVRVQDVNSPVTLYYKAQVWQSSDVDWNNVRLTLSTGDPAQSGTKPEISPVYLSFYQPPVESVSGAVYGLSSKAKAAPRRAYAADAAMELAEEEADESSRTVFTTHEMATNVEFNIDVPYTIPTDGKPHTVDMQSHELEAEYRYACVPKMDEDAFLTALVSNWENLNLLSGKMNLYFEGKYLGESHLDANNPVDSLMFSLGRDKRVVVERKQIKDFTNRQSIGRFRKDTRGYDIKIRNNKSSAINIVIEDQFPISNNDDIEVEHIELSGAEYDEKTGKLKWAFELKAGESKTLTIKYSVKFPKNKQLNNW